MLLNKNMDLVQLYVGSEITFWDLPFAAYGHLAPPGWIKHTWEALLHTPLVLRGPPIAIPRRQHGNVFLMDAFVDRGFSPTILLRLNECRLFLHATTLADITTADGTSLDANAWHGHQSFNQQYCSDTWINTTNPGLPYWQLWQLVLHQLFLVPTAPHLRLHTPLH